jgi:hypothetical protein
MPTIESERTENIKLPDDGIRIHPSGQGRVTDWELARRLRQITPGSFRKAQDVLVAAKRHVAGPAFFRSKRSLIQRLQMEIYELESALRRENYKPEISGRIELAA